MLFNLPFAVLLSDVTEVFGLVSPRLCLWKRLGAQWERVACNETEGKETVAVKSNQSKEGLQNFTLKFIVCLFFLSSLWITLTIYLMLIHAEEGYY